MVTSNLPYYATPFVGRLHEIAEVTDRLHDADCRLLTLVGPGGIGKTRLAAQVALNPMARFADGFAFVPLQPLNSPDFIVSAIAETVGYVFHPSPEPLQQLLSFFSEKALLLVLDNFEHLADGSELLSKIVAAAPRVCILVTSRERLNLVEEWVFEVRELNYPLSESETDIEAYDAVQLFVQQARRVQADFMLTSTQKPAVIRICRMVGGMPLAIELAAAWVRALSSDEISREIKRSLDILESPTRNIEPRHRTMRAAFAPTWNRLSEDERNVFMKLSVFRGGCTREAAQQVAGASLRTLSALVDKSLLRVDTSGRYDLHELLRQYADEKLLDADEIGAAVQCHLDYFLNFAEQVAAHNFGREQISWYDRVEIELDNLRMALTRSLETEAGLRMGVALGWFFTERSHLAEGIMWLESVVAANPHAPVSLRIRGLHSAGAVVDRLDRQRSHVLYEQALALARASNDRLNVAWTLSHMGMAEIGENLDQAAAMLDESLRLFRVLEDAMGMCHTLVRRTWVAMRRQDYPAARPLLEEALILARKADDKIMTGWVHFILGQISEVHDHDLKQTKSYYESGLSLFHEARFSLGVVFIVMRLAPVEQMLGNDLRAQTLFREALGLWGEQWPHDTNNDQAFVGLANTARAQGQFERAAQLLAAVNQDALADYFSKFSELKDSFESDITSVRAQLGEAAFAWMWAAGKAMSRKQAVAYALEDIDTQIQIFHADPKHAEKLPSESFSNRELEILALIADGFSNSEIAEQIILSTGTVKWYVHQILGKLDVTNRTQAVARARTLGLLL